MAVAIRLSTLLVLAALGWSAARGAESISVETRDGRALRGVVDVETDDGTLWLRQEEGNVVLRVPVAWRDVASAMIGDEAIGVDALRERRSELATEQALLVIEEGVSVNVAKTQAVRRAFYLAPRSARVRNLEIVGAGLVNLDRDVEPDGLAVSIVAVGEDGLPVAVRGSLRVELQGERRSVDDPAPRFEELDRWTQRVRSEDFADGVATYCLKFRRTTPEWQFDLSPDAVLSVQLGASGHGNYYASAPVVLRKFNPLRDARQQYLGTRFLPSEVSGWRDQVPFGVRAGMWQWWAR